MEANVHTGGCGGQFRRTHRREVSLYPCARHRDPGPIPGALVVDADHVPAMIGEASDQVATDEAGGTGDESTPRGGVAHGFGFARLGSCVVSSGRAARAAGVAQRGPVAGWA